jgi:hypothetical protein
MGIQPTIEGRDLDQDEVMSIIHGSNLVDEEVHILGVRHCGRIDLGAGHGCRCFR